MACTLGTVGRVGEEGPGGREEDAQDGVPALPRHQAGHQGGDQGHHHHQGPQGAPGGEGNFTKGKEGVVLGEAPLKGLKDLSFNHILIGKGFIVECLCIIIFKDPPSKGNLLQ